MTSSKPTTDAASVNTRRAANFSSRGSLSTTNVIRRTIAKLFMDQRDEAQRYDRTIAVKVRTNITSTAFVAAVLLYLAYNGGYILPEGNGAFEVGGRIFIHTLRFGGFIMLAAAAALLTGARAALLFDGIASIGIGAGIAIGKFLMISNGGGGLLTAICAVMLVVVGVRTVRDWRALPKGPIVAARVVAVPPVSDFSRDIATATPEEPGEIEPKTRESVAREDQAPPPGGFLASFAGDSQADSDSESNDDGQVE